MSGKGQLGQNSCERNAVTGVDGGEDNQDSTARTGRPENDIKDRTAWTSELVGLAD